MIKLYDHPLSGNCYKVRLALGQLEVSFERVNVDIFKGEQFSPEFMALNPNRKIPVLVDGDFVMWESNGILLYLGKRFAPNWLFSEDPRVFGIITQWLFFGKTTLDASLAKARFFTRFAPEGSHEEKELASLREAGRVALQILDDHLKKNDFLVGTYSIADIACYAYTHLAEEGGVSLSPFKLVQSWLEKVRSEPGYISMEG